MKIKSVCSRMGHTYLSRYLSTCEYLFLITSVPHSNMEKSPVLAKSAPRIFLMQNLEDKYARYYQFLAQYVYILPFFINRTLVLFQGCKVTGLYSYTLTNDHMTWKEKSTEWVFKESNCFPNIKKPFSQHMSFAFGHSPSSGLECKHEV